MDYTSAHPTLNSMSKLTIYAIPISLYCAKLRILMRHKELHWEKISPPAGYGSASYKDVVPSGNLPALIDGSLILSDSEAIAEYLNEKHPQPAMLPNSLTARAKVRERSRFHDTRLELEIRALSLHLTSGEPITPERVAASSQILSAKLKQLAQILETTPDAGKELSLGECGFAISFVWIDEIAPALELEIDWPSRVLQYRNRLGTLPSIIDELMDYRPKVKEYFGSE